MIIGWPAIITTLIAWSLNKGIPAIWHHHTDAHKTQVEQAKDLCDNHQDCEAEKIQALQGMKPVTRLEK